MTRVKIFFSISAVLLVLLSFITIDTFMKEEKNITYSTTLTGIPYSSDTLFLRYAGLNGYFSGHYSYPGAYIMQNESFVYSIKENYK